MKEVDIDRIASEYFDDKESEHEMDEVFDLAKKALEERKADVLDKIRAEIKAMSGDIETIADVLQIIDKYKAEGEGVRKIRLVITLNNNTYDEIMNEDKLLSVQAKNDISLAILKAKPLIEYEREIGDMVNAENVFIIEKILAILNG